MNNVFTAKLLNNLRIKKGNKGFTLIELLVVVIIIGVLAAVALPNLLSQVGKARESEGKTTVGSVNRAQQGYHFERQVFAGTTTDIEDPQNPLGVVVNPEFYAYAFTSTTPAADAQVVATDTNAVNNGTRNYGGGIAYAAGAYTTIVCQSNEVGGTVAPTAAATGCGTAATALK